MRLVSRVAAAPYWQAVRPVMTVWFVTIGLLGIGGIAAHPGVLAALDPRYGLGYLFGQVEL